MDLTFSLPIYIIVVLYAFLGAAIKFIDQAYDEERYSRKLANVIAIVAGITMGGLMALDSPFSTAFYGAMILSLVLARKIDNRAFLAGTLIAALDVVGPVACHRPGRVVGPLGDLHPRRFPR